MSSGSSPAARLQQLFEGHRLTPTQRRIAHCMVRRAADAPFLSSVELAELAGVSQPSVTRFAVALGFDGYPALRKHLREVAPGPGEPAARRDDTYNEYQQAVQAEIENLRHLAALLADPAPVAAGGPAARRLPAAARARAARRLLPGARLRATSPPRSTPTSGCSTRAARMLHDRIDAAGRAGATALLCFALPRHPREVVDALAYAQEQRADRGHRRRLRLRPGRRPQRPAASGRRRHRARLRHGLRADAAGPGAAGGDVRRPARTPRRGWRSSTRGRRRGGCSWSERTGVAAGGVSVLTAGARRRRRRSRSGHCGQTWLRHGH